MPPAHTIKIEDARTGQWLRHLDPVTDPIYRIDMGWTMGDWNQLDVSVETVALRGSPLYCMYLRLTRRLVQARRVGEGAARPFTAGLGRGRPALFTRTWRSAPVVNSQGETHTGGSGKGASEAERSGMGCEWEFAVVLHSRCGRPLGQHAYVGTTVWSVSSDECQASTVEYRESSMADEEGVNRG